MSPSGNNFYYLKYWYYMLEKTEISRCKTRNMETKVEIFTDGACSGNPGPAGIGIVLRCGGRVREYSQFIGLGTNNKAELTAVLRALKMMKKTDLETIVHTDSQYTIGILTLGWKAKQNKDLVGEILDEMKRFSRLRFAKVEGHANVPLNERADELARMGILTRCSDAMTSEGELDD